MMCTLHAVPTNMAQLRLGNSAKPAFRLSPIRYPTPLLNVANDCKYNCHENLCTLFAYPYLGFVLSTEISMVHSGKVFQ